MPSRQEILDSVRNKYPQYREIPDLELVTALSNKYPQYKQDLESQSGPQTSIVPPEAEQEIRAQAAASPLDKLSGMATGLVGIVKDVFSNLGGGAGEYVQTLEQATQAPSLNEKIGILSRIPRATAEAGGKLGLDTLDLVSKIANAVKENPSVVTPIGGVMNAFNMLQSKELTPQEVEQQFQNNVANQALAETRSQGTLPKTVTNVIGENKLPQLSEAIEQAASGETGLVVGGSLKVPQIVRKMLGKPHSMLADVTAFKSSDINKINKFNNGVYTGLLPEIKSFYKGPKLTSGGATESFLEAGSKALKERGNTFRPTVDAADEALYTKDKAALTSQVNQKLSESVSTSEIRDRLLDNADIKANINSLTPKNILQRAHELNDDLISFYKKPNPSASPESILAKEALRDTYSGIIKTILDDAGIDPKVYSGYGSIRELTDQIGKNNSLNIYKQEALKGESAAKRFIDNTSATKLFSGLQSVVAPYTGGEVARINKSINTIMRDTPAVKPKFVRPESPSKKTLQKLIEEQQTQEMADQFSGAAMRQSLQEMINAANARQLQSSVPAELPLQ